MSTYKIKVIDKLFKILNLFFEENVELNVGEISEKLGFNRTSTFRIISNLEAEGYLERDLRTSKYRLGLKLSILGDRANPYLHLKRIARPFLEDLNQESGETVHLAVLNRNKAFYLDKIEGKKTIRVVVSQVGQDLPAHCSGVGKVLLAFLPEEESQKIAIQSKMPAFTKNTITSWKELREELRSVRHSGFAMDREEVEYGLSCIAVPVFVYNPVKSVVAAISVSMPINRLELEKHVIKRMVKETAAKISEPLKDNFEYQGGALLSGKDWGAVGFITDKEVEYENRKGSS